MRDTFKGSKLKASGGHSTYAVTSFSPSPLLEREVCFNYS